MTSRYAVRFPCLKRGVAHAPAMGHWTPISRPTHSVKPIRSLLIGDVDARNSFTRRPQQCREADFLAIAVLLAVLTAISFTAMFPGLETRPSWSTPAEMWWRGRMRLDSSPPPTTVSLGLMEPHTRVIHPTPPQRPPDSPGSPLLPPAARVATGGCQNSLASAGAVGGIQARFSFETGLVCDLQRTSNSCAPP